MSRYQTGLTPLRRANVLVNATPWPSNWTLRPSIGLHIIQACSSGVSVKQTTRWVAAIWG